MVLYIPGGSLGFLPSTVSLLKAQLFTADIWRCVSPISDSNKPTTPLASSWKASDFSPTFSPCFSGNVWFMNTKWVRKRGQAASGMETPCFPCQSVFVAENACFSLPIFSEKNPNIRENRQWTPPFDPATWLSRPGQTWHNWIQRSLVPPRERSFPEKKIGHSISVVGFLHVLFFEAMFEAIVTSVYVAFANFEFCISRLCRLQIWRADSGSKINPWWGVINLQTAQLHLLRWHEGFRKHNRMIFKDQSQEPCL